ncbi:hypothetical protein K2P97_10940 [bacterium]|nr:hypothetical protein [bacterium]
MKYFKVLLLLLVTKFAHAGVLGNSVFIEPYVGYRSESIKLTDLALSTTEIKTSQPNFGLKLGYRSLMGIDLNLAGELFSGAASVSGQPENSKFNHTSVSVQLGVNALGLVKMYLGTAFVNDFKLESTTSLPGFKLSGPSFHAGLQFKMFPFVNLGFQYNLNQYAKIEGTAYNTGDKTETYFSKTDSRDYSVYLSTTF